MIPQNEADYLAYLADRSQQPDIQRLVAGWGPLEPDQLTLIARVLGGIRTSLPAQAGEAA
ncbi:hypothetical protein [Nonomuraea wenchangensis]|uniref:Uncharacterized protein n=1 Tax=Nonomuraea wenchangensis TaxID=568860 RepID=A0A1I0F666_9ACTN|nr:hypothetical protein [Nonomuraea wenchangensis]SET52568.1 hypothetical protein SAMN05421811_103312 [Nonomuraea wenchangensis]